MKTGVEFNELVGKIILSIDGMENESEKVRFVCSDGTIYEMWHCQECCEYVRLIDVCGDVSDIIGNIVLKAEESTSNEPDGASESLTWTFYHIRTERGTVTLRWLGESNGYYSESVNLYRIDLVN